VRGDSEKETIRNKAFGKRLSQAVSSHPRAPGGHGQQAWLRQELKNRFALETSKESLSKWFAGVVLPRPRTLNQIAEVLQVDPAWLSMGVTPITKPKEKMVRNAVASGVVNYVAGLIQMQGGTIAFPASESEDIDLIAIVNGEHLSFQVKAFQHEKSMLKLHLSPKVEGLTVLGVDLGKGFADTEIIRVPHDVIEKHATKKGGFQELTLDSNYRVDGEALPKVVGVQDLLPGGRKQPVRKALDLP
jgi:transcriptional regulator with XRE-family HTH domain